MVKHYIGSDGNGGVKISNSMIMLFALIISMIIGISSVVAYAAGTRGDVKNLQSDVDKIDKFLINARESEQSAVKELREKDVSLEKTIIEINAKLDYIIKYVEEDGN